MDAAADPIFLDAVRALCAAQDEREFIDRLLRDLRILLRCGGCSFSVPDAAGENLLLNSIEEGLLGKPIPVPRPNGFVWQTFLEKRIIRIDEAANHPAHFSIRQHGGHSTRALLSVPLLIGDRCVGVVQAVNPEGRSSFSDDDATLAQGFASLVAVTLERIHQRAEQLRTERELAAEATRSEAARKIQASLLPQPRVTLRGWSVEFFHRQAEKLGGDFFFHHEIEAGRHLLVVGDAEGHDLPAALVMVAAQALISASVGRIPAMGLAAWVQSLADDLLKSRRVDDENGVSFAATFFHLRAVGPAEIVVCGQEPPWCETPGGWARLAVRPAPPLGRDSFPLPDVCSGGIHGFPRILFFTDGFTDALRTARTATVRSWLSSPDASADALREIVSHSHSPRDDITACLIEKTSAFPQDVTLTSIDTVLREGREWAISVAAYFGIGDSAQRRLVTAVDELLANIITHAFQNRRFPGQSIALHAGTESRAGVIEILHNGSGLTDDEIARIDAHRNQLSGGRGIAFIREAFPDAHFTAEGKTYRITLPIPLPEPLPTSLR